jgi:hypothetical protein
LRIPGVEIAQRATHEALPFNSSRVRTDDGRLQQLGSDVNGHVTLGDNDD